MLETGNLYAICGSALTCGRTGANTTHKHVPIVRHAWCGDLLGGYKRMSPTRLVTIGALTLALAACNKEKAPEPTPETPPATPTAVADAGGAAQAGGSGTAEGNKVFKQRCAVCHGNEGKGDGPGSEALNPKPRAFVDQAWQAKTTDEQLRKVILYGGLAVGMSAIMPASPELKKKPEVVNALIAKIRSFK